MGGKYFGTRERKWEGRRNSGEQQTIGITVSAHISGTEEVTPSFRN